MIVGSVGGVAITLDGGSVGVTGTARTAGVLMIAGTSIANAGCCKAAVSRYE